MIYKFTASTGQIITITNPMILHELNTAGQLEIGQVIRLSTGVKVEIEKIQAEDVLLKHASDKAVVNGVI